MIFQNFVPFKKYELPLMLRNNDSVPRLIKVIQDASPYFKIVRPNDAGRKVAPGMSTTYQVCFFPDAIKDYAHELICVSEREKFLIPIKCIGARGMIDIPDVIEFGECPVKMTKSKTLFVRNVGNDVARFSLSSAALTFETVPNCAELKIQEATQITIEFKPTLLMDYHSELKINYDTGEEVHVILRGTGTNIDVRMDKYDLVIPATYVGMANFKTFLISNRGSEMVRYHFSAYATVEEEEMQKRLSLDDIETEESQERNRYLSEVADDPSLRDRISILTRSFQNRRVNVSNDILLFSDPEIDISPVEGNVYPGKSIEVSLVFKPEKIGICEKSIFCDVEGREQRLPLHITAVSIGPQLSLSYDAVDIGKIFIGSLHTYDLILSNQGEIDGIFSFVESKSSVSKQFGFIPTEGIVMPGGYQLIEITFAADIIGTFQEVFHFNIDGTDDTLKFEIQGEVIGPTFYIEPSNIQLGVVSLGFPHEKWITITNTSLVPMDFELVISGDEMEDGVFSIDPKIGKLEPESTRDILLTFQSTRDKLYHLSLDVNIPGIGQGIMCFPITVDSKAPKITTSTTEFNLGRAFLDYPYYNVISLINESTELKATYQLTELLPDQLSQFAVTSNVPTGIIEPGETLNLPIVVRAKGLGALNETVTINIKGSPEPVTCDIIGNGVGPVVIAEPNLIDFGSIAVLQPSIMQMNIANESLILAELTVAFVKDQTIWSVDHRTLLLQPESATIINVSANLDDSVEFNDMMIISVNNGNQIEIPLRAVGIGTTIVTVPSMNSTPGNGIDLGARFSSQTVSKEIKFINRGRRHQHLTWSIAGYERLSQRVINDQRQYEHLMKSKDVRFKNLPPPGPPPTSVFSFSQMDFSLEPGESISANLNGMSDEPGTVKETMLCHAVIGRSKGKTRIMQVPIHCQYIQPLIKASTTKVHFQIDKDVDDVLATQRSSFSLENVSSLTLRLQLRTNKPFSIQHFDSHTCEVTLNPNEVKHFEILFNPNYRDDFVSRRLTDELTIDFLDHPSYDVIALTAEVNFPNIEFSQAEVDFGTILNETESAVTLSMKNHSPLPVQYHWWFEIEDDGGIVVDGSTTVQRSNPLTSAPTPFEKQEADDEGVIHNSDDEGGILASITSFSNQNRAQSPRIELRERLTIEKVFDILPLFGRVEPGEQVLTTVTFTGHSNVLASCKAVCEVEGGPQYELNIKGKSSYVEFNFSEVDIDFDKVLFDCLCERDITLSNRGTVGFTFCTDDSVAVTTQDLVSEVICVYPNKGFLPANSEITLKIGFIPGVPEHFRHSFHIKIGHFKPTEFTLSGEGVFPRISLDLPRGLVGDSGEDNFEKVIEIVRNEVEINSVGPVSNLELEMEAERIIIAECARATPKNQILRVNKASRFALPDYVLDFGPVILGEVRSHIVRATNTGTLPVSFALNHAKLFQSGFFCELDRVKSLPGYPRHETVDFKFTFDPRGASLDLGLHEVHVPINIVQGPTITLRVRANVTMPAIMASETQIEFGMIECGRCKVVSIQLYNPLDVDAVWKYRKTPDKRFDLDKHMPMHLRRQARKQQKPLPRVFEIMPNEGVLNPKQRATIQIRFLPMEDETYEEKLTLIISDSIQRIDIATSGVGVQPQIAIDQNIVELGPILPFSTGTTIDITVTNPSTVPVEFYSLDFDDRYLEEEDLLRKQKGYDKFANLMLPPRAPGDALPIELYHKEEPKEDPILEDESDVKVDKIEIIEKHDPVQLAVAKHLGIDMSPEGQAARNRLGTSVIIWGAPFSGKTTIARSISQHYGASLLTIDDIVMESIISGTSIASKTAREMCQEETAKRQTEVIVGAESDVNTDQNLATSKDDAVSVKTNMTQSKSVKGSTTGSKQSGPRGVKGSGSTTEQPVTATLLPQRHIGRLGSTSASIAGDNVEPLLTCLLPEDLVAEIIAERLQLSDCYRGVIIDGLESCFLPNIQTALQTVLKGLNNRKYIHIINTKLTYKQYDKRIADARQKQAELEAKRKNDDQEIMRNMTEEEYDALPDAERTRIDNLR